jgi:hypothetical protein
MRKKLIVAAAAAFLATAAMAQEALAGQTDLILHNQSADGNSASDVYGIWSGKTTAAGGTSTGGASISGNVYETVTATANTSGAYCTYSASAVYSSLYGHYVITMGAVTPHTVGGVTPTCSGSLTYKDATTGDFDMTMYISGF